MSSPLITPEAYLLMERQSPTKHEYVNGVIYAMVGASREHVVIMFDVGRILGNQLEGNSCEPYGSDMRVKVNQIGLYTYPDVTVACDPQFEDDTLLNPVVIIEVHSPSTEAYDRGEKWAHYQRLDSLRDYVPISQHRPRIEHFTRQSDNSWLLRTIESPGEVVQLQSIGCVLRLEDVYARVDFSNDTPLTVHSNPAL